MSKLRKIFNYDNLSESKMAQLNDYQNIYFNTISAAGCLFYKDDNKLLLIEYADPNWTRLDDFGGVVDENDETIYDTIIRETAEETNNIIDEKLMKQLLENNDNKYFYNKLSKYFFVLIRVDDYFFPNTYVFGIKEQHDQILRKVKWYDFEEIKQKLAYRLSNTKKLMSFLSKV